MTRKFTNSYGPPTYMDNTSFYVTPVRRITVRVTGEALFVLSDGLIYFWSDDGGGVYGDAFLVAV